MVVLLPHPTDFTEPWAFWDFAADQVSPSIPTGVASVVVSFFLSMYYNVINAWAFWYLFHSFQVCGLPVAQFGPTVAVEGRGGFALVHTRHHCQLGRGGGGLSKLQKPRAFLEGKVTQWCLPPWSSPRHLPLLLTMKFRSRPAL